MPRVASASASEARALAIHAPGTRRPGAFDPEGERAPRPAARSRSANQAARLSGAAAFETMFRLGARVEGRYVQVLSTPAQQPSGRVGYVISRKVMARAVDRNRLKRRLREFLRGARSQVRQLDIVIRVKRPIPPDAMDDAFREACALIEKAVRGSDMPVQAP